MVKTGQAMKMVDFASKDPRSVSAMLRGKGDGREKGWLKFQKLNAALYSEEQLQAAFKKASRLKDQQANAGQGRAWSLGKGLLAFLAVMLIAF